MSPSSSLNPSHSTSLTSSQLSSSQDPSQSTSLTSSQPTSPSQSTSPALSQSLSQSPTLSDKPPTISFACRRQELVPVRDKRRPRKPSPLRNRRPSSDDLLEEFLSRGCRCASKCYRQFDRVYYGTRRDEANALTKDELDMVVLGQIMACMSVSPVVGPSHKHTPHRRQQVKTTFFHQGKKICRDTFLALHGLGKPHEIII